MDKDTWIGFEDYKDKLINSAKLKARTKEERNADFKEAQMIAEMALKKLNPKNDLGILPTKKVGE